MRPGERITVDGSACRIVRDAVADRIPVETQDVVVLGRQDRRFFYAAGEEMRRARKEAADARVVGLWNLLSASRAIDERGLYVIYFDERRNGQYLYDTNEATFVGEVRDGEPIESFGYAVNLEQAREIRVADVVWRLPSRTFDEQDAAERRRAFVDRAMAFAGVALLAGVAGVVWIHEREAEAARLAALESSRDLRQAIAGLEGQVAEARAQHVAAWPRQADALQQFVLLALNGATFSTRNARVSDTNMAVTLNTEEHRRMLAAMPQAMVEHKPDGTSVLRWRNSAEAR